MGLDKMYRHVFEAMGLDFVFDYVRINASQVACNKFSTLRSVSCVDVRQPVMYVRVCTSKSACACVLLCVYDERCVRKAELAVRAFTGDTVGRSGRVRGYKMSIIFFFFFFCFFFCERV